MPWRCPAAGEVKIDDRIMAANNKFDGMKRIPALLQYEGTKFSCIQTNPIFAELFCLNFAEIHFVIVENGA